MTQELLHWLSANKEWVFSGSGVAIVVAVWSWVFRRRPAESPSQKLTSVGSSTNVQAARDVNITFPEKSGNPPSNGSNGLSTNNRSDRLAEHDAAIFNKADEILSEAALVEFLDWLQTDDSYTRSRMLAVEQFRCFFNETSNHFVAQELASSVKPLLTSLESLVVFIGLNFFVFPEGQPLETDWRYCMQPELNNDRAGKGELSQLTTYDELQEELDSLCKIVRGDYKSYRRLVKHSLFL